MKITLQHTWGFFLGIAVLTFGCSPNTVQESEPTPAADAGEVNLYTSRHYDTDEQLYEEFTKQTGIQVNAIEGEADELIERIKSEGVNSPADVFITVDVGRLWRAQQEAILKPISSSELEAAVPANLRSPEGDWFGLSKRARVIVYNQESVDPAELSTYEALAEPEWQNRVCVRSSSNIYNQSLVAAKIEEKGVEGAEMWAKGLVNNLAREPEGNDTDQIEAVAAGQCDVALVNHYYVARIKQSDEPQEQEIASKVGVFFPNQEAGGTHINISGAGVAANAPNQENAIKFLEFLVTAEAQEIFANANYEYPIVSELEPDSTVADFGDFKASELEVAAYGENNAEAVEVMDRAGWK